MRQKPPRDHRVNAGTALTENVETSGNRQLIDGQRARETIYNGAQ
jgi:hypothetical protein